MALSALGDCADLAERLAVEFAASGHRESFNRATTVPVIDQRRVQVVGLWVAWGGVAWAIAENNRRRSCPCSRPSTHRPLTQRANARGSTIAAERTPVRQP